MSTSRTAAGSETALLSYSWTHNIIINFFVDSHTILSTHRVHGTSAAWCFCGSIVPWYTGTGVSLPCPSPLKLLCCRCFLNFRRVRDLHVPCYWCEMLQGMGYPPRFWKTCFFFSDTRFVIRAIYIPCLFQPLTRWLPIIRDIWGAAQGGNYTLSAIAVGLIHVTYPPSMNPVGVVT